MSAVLHIVYIFWFRITQLIFYLKFNDCLLQIMIGGEIIKSYMKIELQPIMFAPEYYLIWSWAP